jgi:hypothetical protein
MSGIEGIGGPVPTPRIIRRAQVRSSQSFIAPEEAAADQPVTSSAETQETSLATMLALQELNGEAVEDRQARRRGQDMLALLARLQRDLLAGADDATSLQRLAQLAAVAPAATDPRLAAAVAAIVLRVQVELARRQG